MRNNTVYTKACEESLLTNTEIAPEWLKTVWSELKNDIHNADNTGCFYNLTSEMTFKFKNEKYQEEKIKKSFGVGLWKMLGKD